MGEQPSAVYSPALTYLDTAWYHLMHGIDLSGLSLCPSPCIPISRLTPLSSIIYKCNITSLLTNRLGYFHLIRNIFSVQLSWVDLNNTCNFRRAICDYDNSGAHSFQVICLGVTCEEGAKVCDLGRVTYGRGPALLTCWWLEAPPKHADIPEHHPTLYNTYNYNLQITHTYTYINIFIYI